MLYKTLSAAVYGIDASIIEVEVDVSGVKCDEDHVHTVALPDPAVRESRDRVRAALRTYPIACSSANSRSTAAFAMFAAPCRSRSKLVAARSHALLFLKSMPKKLPW